MPEQIIYQDMVETKLRIPKEFLTEYRDLIRQKLTDAAAVAGEEGGVLTVNRCLHLASSVVLRNGTHLDEVLGQIRTTEGFETIDPTTVVTVATLYYLLNAEPEDAAQGETLGKLREQFGKLNWLIGTDAMQRLGFQA